MAEPTATTTSITAAQIGAIAALAGALIGSMAGFFTKLVTEWIDRREKRREVIRDHLDQISLALTKTVTWFNALDRCRTLAEAEKCGDPHEADTLVATANLYFPEMIPDVSEYSALLNKKYWEATEVLNHRNTAFNDPSSEAFLEAKATVWVVDIDHVDYWQKRRDLHSKIQLLVRRRAVDWREGTFLPWWRKIWQEAGETY